MTTFTVILAFLLVAAGGYYIGWNIGWAAGFSQAVKEK